MHSYYGKGSNFETAAQFLVAVDFTNVVDKNWTFKSRDKWYTKAKTKVADGPGTAVMTASVDEYVETDGSVSMSSAIDQLAYDSTVKATVSGEVVLLRHPSPDDRAAESFGFSAACRCRYRQNHFESSTQKSL